MQDFNSTCVDSYSEIFDELWPICRSISGKGLRDSISVLRRYMDLDMEGVPSGTEVFDWVVPKEWKFNRAVLTGPDGEVVLDSDVSNLHVVNYSSPISGRMSLEDLQPHLHSIPTQPDLIPYVTSYYQERWGFCLTHHQREKLQPGTYSVEIDSAHTDGEVNFATGVIAGDSSREILLSSYLCHPSMANNELSGPLVLLGLYDRIKKWQKRKFSYRFLLNPETIGSLCFLHRYGDRLMNKLEAGAVLTCLGGPRSKLSYMISRETGSGLDATVTHLSNTLADRIGIRPFSPVGGSDERQFCSPGFNLPIGQFARTTYHSYESYHTSGDDKEFMQVEQVLRSVDEIEKILILHEQSGPWTNTIAKGEPQLGKRGLYTTINSPNVRAFSTDKKNDDRTFRQMIMWVLNDADGKRTLIDTAKKSGFPLEDLAQVASVLEEHGLLLNSSI